MRTFIFIFLLSFALLAAENVSSANDSVSNDETPVKAFDLAQNFPNPFNPSTTIQFSLPTSSDVTIELYDLLGNKVKTLVDSKYESGTYTIKVDGSDLAAGVYFYSMTSGDDYKAMRRMTLIK